MELAQKIDAQIIEESPVKTKKSYEGFKRFFDLSFALLMIPFLLPIMLMIAFLIKIDSRGPVFFSHRRVGKEGHCFNCYKFRTMVKDAEGILPHILKNGKDQHEWKKDFKLRNDPRVTRVGKWLRRFSLDELPQIFNVIIGNMSLVGPRPIVKEEILKYGQAIHHYYGMKPGITGLWQVSGRNDTNYAQRVNLDKNYSLEKSFLLDLKIILKTIPTVLSRRGAY